MSFSAIRTLVRCEEAATAVEYAVMLALILLAVIASIGAFGGAASGIWGNDANKILSATSGTSS
jgi:pilus assembly protein Flp/PilA